MAKIIIGIHGLANKPPKTKLKKYWRLSIQEGLDNVRCQEKFSFEMVFWADLMYKNLLHEDATYCSDSLFNKQPYHPARRGRLKAYRMDGLIRFVLPGLRLWLTLWTRRRECSDWMRCRIGLWNVL